MNGERHVSKQSLHIAHVIYALKTGGLENGLVNLINRLPIDEYRHTIICLTDSDDFAKRITRPDVTIHALHKRAGHDLGIFVRLFQLFRTMQPDIVHTRNLATIEAQIPAWLARVPVRIHGEHGRDRNDPDGMVKKYQWLRQTCAFFIQHFIALSAELERYLLERVRIAPNRIIRICNGVDTERFKPRLKPENPPHPFGPGKFIIGYVGRMDAVKDPLNLVRAFIQLHTDAPNTKLVMIGDGAECDKARVLLEHAGLSKQAWLPGAQHHVAEIMQSFEIYVLPSMAEGISNTLLEAMACGLPVVATRVGGNSELVVDGESALLVERENSAALSEAIKAYIEDPELRQRHGDAARVRVEQFFSLDGMVRQYADVYQQAAIQGG